MSRRSLRLSASRLLLGLALVLTAPATWAEEAVADAAGCHFAMSDDLAQQAVCQLLLAEIAGARGRSDVAVINYLDLAQRARDPRIARRATEVALLARKGPEALDAARLWAEVDPASEEATQMLAGLLAGGLGKPDELEGLLANLMARRGKSPAGMLMGLNRALGRYGDKKEVLQRVMRLTEPYLALPEASFARAQAALNVDDTHAALAALDKALSIRPDFESAALLKLQTLQKAGQTKEAIAFAHSFVAKRPTALETRYALGRLLAIDHQYAPARGVFEKLVKDAPSNGEYGYTYAQVLEQLGDTKAAEAELKRLLDLGQPDPDSVKIQLGQVYEDAKRPADAITVYRSVGDGALRGTAIARWTLLRARGGDLAGARAELQQLRDANPKEANGLYLIEAQMLRDLKQVPAALGLLEGVLAKQGDQAELLYEYAMLAERADKIEVMEPALRKVIALKPDDPQAYNALGYVLADHNTRLDEAQALLTKALELAPDDAFIQDSVGWVMFRKGDLAGALKFLQRAYAGRADPEIAAHLGEVLWVMGQHEEARKTWETARKASPDNEELTKVIKRFTP